MIFINFIIAVIYLIGTLAFIASLAKALKHHDKTPKLLCLLLIITSLMSTIYYFYIAFTFNAWYTRESINFAKWDYWIYYFCMP